MRRLAFPLIAAMIVCSTPAQAQWSWPNGQQVYPQNIGFEPENSEINNTPDCLDNFQVGGLPANGNTFAVELQPFFDLPHGLPSQTYLNPGSGGVPANTPALPPPSKHATAPGLHIGGHIGLQIPAYCGPFEWAASAFLWLTSPTGKAGDERIFDSPIFFDLSLPDAKGKYTLIQNQPGKVPTFHVRSGKPSVDVAPGQTIGDVLMSQPQNGDKSGSLVYYQIAVNDVYAYFATAAKTGALQSSYADHFPTTQADLDAIRAYANKNHLIFSMAAGHTGEEALAMEVKTSWVEASKVPPNCKYITRTAAIPTYDMSNPRKWVMTGKKTTSLALVGMHIAGSGGGHPEMIWATFEHICNTPDAPYPALIVYDKPGTELDSTPAGSLTFNTSTKGHWLFAADGTTGPFNQPRMSLEGTNIVATGKLDIGPSDARRAAAWGSAGSDGHVTDLNTQIVMLNSAVNSIYQGADIRSWYVLIGAIWTADGRAPTGNNLAGATSLANSTMETYLQGAGKNCFACHTTSGAAVGTRMSHIFDHIDPLILTSVAAEHAAPAPGPTTSSAGAQAAPVPAASTSSAAGQAAPAPGAAPSATNTAVNQAVGSVMQYADTLIKSLQTAVGLSCTYQQNGTTFVRHTKKGTCPATAPPPTSTGSTTGPAPRLATQPVESSVTEYADTLVKSEQTTAGLSCTYRQNATTFVRHTKKATCPASAAPPTPSGSTKLSAPASDDAASSAESGAVLVGSKESDGKLVCTYRLGGKTFTKTTKKSVCPPTVE